MCSRTVCVKAISFQIDHRILHILWGSIVRYFRTVLTSFVPMGLMFIETIRFGCYQNFQQCRIFPDFDLKWPCICIWNVSLKSIRTYLIWTKETDWKDKKGFFSVLNLIKMCVLFQGFLRKRCNNNMKIFYFISSIGDRRFGVIDMMSAPQIWSKPRSKWGNMPLIHAFSCEWI